MSSCRDQFREYVEQSIDVIFHLKPDGTFLFVSPSWESHFGSQPSSVIGYSFIIHVHPDDVAPLSQYLQKCLTTDEAITSPEYRVKHSDGHWVDFVSNGHRYLSEDGEYQYIGIAHDISATKRIQNQLAEKNREMERLLFISSHDLRAPLLNIRGFTEELQNDLNDILKMIELLIDSKDKRLYEQFIHSSEEIHQYIQYIFKNSEKMDGLIQSLMKLARTGNVEMKLEQIDMNQVVQNVLDEFHFQMSSENIVVDISPLPECVADANLMNQVFSNLVGNAIKYKHPERPLQIRIDGHTTAKTVRYCVQDNGMGIPQKHIERVWDVFYRVNPQVGKPGDGIGLAIIRKIIERHHGQVWLESSETEGTRFFLEIPTI